MDCGHTVGILAVMAGFLCGGAVGIGVEGQDGRGDEQGEGSGGREGRGLL